MTRLEKFNEHFNQYQLNDATFELKTIIDKVINDLPKTIYYKEEKWDVYETIDKTEGKTYVLKVNHSRNEFELIEKLRHWHHITEIKRTNYYIGLYNEMYVEKEIIKNQIINHKIGAHLLVDAEKTEERFTQTGFQKSKSIKEIIGEHFIFINDEQQEKYEIFVPLDFTRNPGEGLIDCIKFNILKKEYWLSHLNNTIKASLEETNNLVVFYKENDNTVCFPAFFDGRKKIYIDGFIDDAKLQFYAIESSGVRDENISFEHHTIKDADKFYFERREIVDCLKEYERFENINKKLKK